MKPFVILLALLVLPALASAQSISGPVKKGYTGDTTHLVNSVLIGNTKSAIKHTTAAGSDSSLFLRYIHGSTPVWTAVPSTVEYNNIDAADGKWSFLFPSGGTSTDDPSDTSKVISYKTHICVKAGTLRGLTITPSVIGCTGDTLTVTLYKNGVATSAVAKCAGHQWIGADDTHSVSVVRGDALSIKVAIVSGGACLDASPLNVGWEFDYKY